MVNALTFTTTERESIGLCIVVEALDEMVNHRLLNLSGEHSTGESNVNYKSDVHQQLFTVLLLDFVHEGGAEAVTGVKGSCLDVIEAACRTRSFDRDGSVALLEAPLMTLRTWLNKEVSIDPWLPSLNLKANLDIKRLDLLRVSGNQSKHNLSRLTGVSKILVEILSANKHSFPIEQIHLAHDDFRQYFDEHCLAYYGTWLAELLNNLRWGVQDYLLPQYEMSCELSGNANGYTYAYPQSVSEPTARAWYCRLMNGIRRGPYFRRFVGSSYFKKEELFHAQKP